MKEYTEDEFRKFLLNGNKVLTQKQIGNIIYWELNNEYFIPTNFDGKEIIVIQYSRDEFENFIKLEDKRHES